MSNTTTYQQELDLKDQYPNEVTYIDQTLNEVARFKKNRLIYRTKYDDLNMNYKISPDGLVIGQKRLVEFVPYGFIIGEIKKVFGSISLNSLERFKSENFETTLSSREITNLIREYFSLIGSPGIELDHGHLIHALTELDFEWVQTSIGSSDVYFKLDKEKLISLLGLERLRIGIG